MMQQMDLPRPIIRMSDIPEIINNSLKTPKADGFVSADIFADDLSQ